MTAATCCPHLRAFFDSDSSHANLLAASQHNLHQECGYCYIACESDVGLHICLQCLQGYCTKNDHLLVHMKHYPTHVEYVTVQRTLIPHEDVSGKEGFVKIANVEEYSVNLSLHCGSCHISLNDLDEKQNRLLSGIKQAYTLPFKVDAPEEFDDLTECAHVRDLIQEPQDAYKNIDHCCSCDMKTNMWKCLGCGYVGCGRTQSDGSGGNGHAAAHNEETKHQCSVKLGTITPEGQADVYCYICDEIRRDKSLERHLLPLGLKLSEQRKTELNMAELEIEKSKKIDYGLTKEEGVDKLVVANGGKYIGLRNLGNSCYFSSIMQVSHRLPALSSLLSANATSHIQECRLNPYNCLLCQLAKFMNSLMARNQLSRKLIEKDKLDLPENLYSFSPSALKRLVASGHREFASGRQQDAFEFWQHWIKSLRKVECSLASSFQKLERRSSRSLDNIFKFDLVQQLICSSCSFRSYSNEESYALSLPLPPYNKELNERLSLSKCLNHFMKGENVEFTCSQCKVSRTGVKKYYFGSVPECLVIHLQRFTCDERWRPVKLTVPVDMPMSNFSLKDYALPSSVNLEAELRKADTNKVDQTLLNSLMSMGFDSASCEHAIRKNSGCKDMDVLVSWLFDHSGETQLTNPTSSSYDILENNDDDDADSKLEALAVLLSMGFTEKQAKRALAETEYDSERAMDWLLSHPMDKEMDDGIMNHGVLQEAPNSRLDPASIRYDILGCVVHKGPSADCGHYLAICREMDHKETLWTNASVASTFYLYNDDKVSQWQDVHEAPPLLDYGYLYFYYRQYDK